MNFHRAFTALFAALFLVLMAGCVGGSVVRHVGANNEPPFQVVQVFFGTDRLAEVRSKMKIYSDSRGDLSYGLVNVSIPRSHNLGELERPSLWRLEFREDQSKHITVRSIENLDHATFHSTLSRKIGASAKKSALVYVHGYNVSFQDSALRAAQMAYDLAFDGAVAFYSWPSRGQFASYTVDEQSAAWAEPNLEKFLLDFSKLSGAENIYLIAHSMGARPLTGAYLSAIKKAPDAKAKFKELILAAPDIDSAIFVRDIVPALVKFQTSTTLYASSNDEALKASRSIHGSPRAGESGPRITVETGVETIDASSVETDFIGHSYYAENRSIISDIFYLVRNGLRAKDRATLLDGDLNGVKYWKFRR